MYSSRQTSIMCEALKIDAIMQLYRPNKYCARDARVLVPLHSDGGNCMRGNCGEGALQLCPTRTHEFGQSRQATQHFDCLVNRNSVILSFRCVDHLSNDTQSVLSWSVNLRN